MHGFCRPALLTISILLFAWKGLFLPARADQNWPQWRGPHGNGWIEAGTYPTALTSPSWKALLPGKGCSTPAIWNHEIYLTAPISGQDALLAFSWAGESLWQTKLGTERPGKNRNGSGSNPSPVTDGRHIFTYFKSGTLAAVTRSGQVAWQTNLIERFGQDTLYWDYGTSPVLTTDDVVVALMHHGESWLAAFDKATGRLHWKITRNFETPDENDHSYATPLLIQHRGQEALLVWGGEHLTAHSTGDGHLLWSCAGFNPQAKPNWVAVASPVVEDDLAVVPFGRGTRLHGIKLNGEGDVTSSHRLWERQNTGSFVSTPVAHEGRVYLVRDRGEVECIDVKSGRSIWTKAFPKSSASYYASPLLAGNLLYAAREDGVVFVARVDPDFEVLSENPLQEPVIASPVGLDGRILIRGEKHLFCFDGGGATAAPKSTP